MINEPPRLVALHMESYENYQPGRLGREEEPSDEPNLSAAMGRLAAFVFCWWVQKCFLRLVLVFSRRCDLQGLTSLSISFGGIVNFDRVCVCVFVF